VHEERANNKLVHYFIFVLMYADLALTDLPIHTMEFYLLADQPGVNVTHPLLLWNQQLIIILRHQLSSALLETI